jgi:hypothetical protein
MRIKTSAAQASMAEAMASDPAARASGKIAAPQP